MLLKPFVLANIFFTPNDDGTFAMTGAGTALMWGIIAALLLVGAFIVSHAMSVKLQTKQLAFCAMAVALATVTSMIKLFDFPTGGSITLFSMLFIVLIGYWYGPVIGIFTGMAFGILQLIMGPYILHPMQVLLDYPLAFGGLGFSGFFRNSKYGLYKGYIAGAAGRYIFSFLSGWIFFGSYAWKGWNPAAYSLVYHLIYIGAESVMTLLVLRFVPALRKAIDYIKESAE